MCAKTRHKPAVAGGCRWLLVAAVLAGVLAGAFGCNGRPLTPEARRLLESGIDAFRQSDHAAAVERLDTFLRDYGRMRRTDEAHYYRGLAHYQLSHTVAAREDFERTIARTRRDDLRGNSLIALGDMAYSDGDMAQAERMFAQSLDNLQRAVPPRDHALYWLGMALQSQGRWHQADVYFNQLDGDFGGSELADRAGLLVNARHWTVQAGAFDNQSDANKLAATLRRNDLSVRLWWRMVAGELVIYVWVGQFSTYEQAEAAVPQVREICPEAFPAAAR